MIFLFGLVDEGGGASTNQFDVDCFSRWELEKERKKDKDGQKKK